VSLYLLHFLYNCAVTIGYYYRERSVILKFLPSLDSLFTVVAVIIGYYCYENGATKGVMVVLWWKEGGIL
jgi:hypothetical protein